jgi:hypothetical protein
MWELIYAEETLRQARERRIDAVARRRAADPKAEVPRTGVGLVHEVFRRIAEGERPAPRPQPRRVLGWR